MREIQYFLAIEMIVFIFGFLLSAGINSDNSTI